MDDISVKRLALILAVQAEIEGMKADNANREQMNESIAWDYVAFSECSAELRRLANAPDHQLD